MLTDGTFMLGRNQLFVSQAALLDASTLTWTFVGGDFPYVEQGYVLLQSGAVLTVSTTDQTSKRYEPNLKQFVQDANLPVMLGDGSEEIGPGITMMNGNVIWFGATGHTCIYTPGSQGQNGKWTQGPDLPTMVDGTQLVCTDTTAILEPNGKVFVVTWWGAQRELSSSLNMILAETSSPWWKVRPTRQTGKLPKCYSFLMATAWYGLRTRRIHFTI